MTRSHRSARAAGTRFETAIAACLAEHVDDRIERRVRGGAKDRGDVSGVRTIGGHRVVIEAKNTNRLELGVWVGEADIERGNDDALVGVVWHKRRGKADPLDSYVTMTGRDFVALLTGERPSDLPEAFRDEAEARETEETK